MVPRYTVVSSVFPCHCVAAVHIHLMEQSVGTSADVIRAFLMIFRPTKLFFEAGWANQILVFA